MNFGHTRATYAACSHQPQHEWKQRSSCMRLQMAERRKKAASGKRVRHVVSTGEIAHLWAHQVQSDARNSCGSMFFQSQTILSYGWHYPIARIVEVKSKKCVLFTNRKSSSSTSGHKSAVRSAIPPDVQVFEVRNTCKLPYGWSGGAARYGGGYFDNSDPDAATHAENIADLVKTLTDEVAAIGRARSAWAKRWKTRSARDTRNNLLAYAKFFRLKTVKLPEVPKLSGAQLAKLDRHQKQLEATRAQRTLERNAALIRRWKVGANVQLPSGRRLWRNPLPVMLRVVGNEVETSLGVRVPVTHAKSLLDVVRRVRERGEDFVANGRSIHVGHYTISRINAKNDAETIIAGCHRIPWASIAEVAPAVEAAALAEVTA